MITGFRRLRRGVTAAAAIFILAGCSGDQAPVETVLDLAADPAGAGRVLFRECAVCHPAKPGEPARIGPNLYGVVGRPAGSAPDFAYSQAFDRLDIVWDATALDAYLADPQGFARGNRMAYPGEPDPEKRAAIIAYLQSLTAAQE